MYIQLRRVTFQVSPFDRFPTAIDRREEIDCKKLDGLQQEWNLMSCVAKHICLKPVGQEYQEFIHNDRTCYEGAKEWLFFHNPVKSVSPPSIAEVGLATVSSNWYCAKIDRFASF